MSKWWDSFDCEIQCEEVWFKDHEFPAAPESEDVMDLTEVVSLDHLKSPIVYNNEDELIEIIDNQWVFNVGIECGI